MLWKRNEIYGVAEILHLSMWPYVRQVPFTGILTTDVPQFLNANGKQHTAAHCGAVAKTSAELSARFRANRDVAEPAALLHDISNVLRHQDMMDYAVQCGWMIDEAEKKHPFLLHQRVSAMIAKDVFGIQDQTILSAIECHATLKSNPSQYDMILFLADKLSWDQEGPPPFFNVVSDALNHSLIHASLAYINFVMENNMILFPHQWLLEARIWLQGNLR